MTPIERKEARVSYTNANGERVTGVIKDTCNSRAGKLVLIHFEGHDFPVWKKHTSKIEFGLI